MFWSVVLRLRYSVRMNLTVDIMTIPVISDKAGNYNLARLFIGKQTKVVTGLEVVTNIINMSMHSKCDTIQTMLIRVL